MKIQHRLICGSKNLSCEWEEPERLVKREDSEENPIYYSINPIDKKLTIIMDWEKIYGELGERRIQIRMGRWRA